MRASIFILRQLTYTSIFAFEKYPCAIVGEIHEELTSDGIIRVPMVYKYPNEPIVCPYCLCNHDVPAQSGFVFPECDDDKCKGVVKDEHGTIYTAKKDGYFLRYL